MDIFADLCLKQSIRMTRPMSTEQSVLEKAAALCLRNAKQYIKDADLLYSFKSHGHALALTVLANIEIGKCVIYHLWSKDLISGQTLPPPFQSYFWEKKYGLFASETWWIGLTIASNIEELMKEMIDASEEAGDATSHGGGLATPALQRISQLTEKMRLENNKLKELEDDRTISFFVDFSVHDASVFTPEMVERKLVKERIKTAKQLIRVGAPFLSLSLSDVPRKIARILLEEAFYSVLPIKDRISQFVLPSLDQIGSYPTG